MIGRDLIEEGIMTNTALFSFVVDMSWIGRDLIEEGIMTYNFCSNPLPSKRIGRDLIEEGIMTQSIRLVLPHY